MLEQLILGYLASRGVLEEDIFKYLSEVGKFSVEESSFVRPIVKETLKSLRGQGKIHEQEGRYYFVRSGQTDK